MDFFLALDLNFYRLPFSRIPGAPNPDGDRQSRFRSTKAPPTDRARSKSPRPGSISAITPNLYVGDIHASRSITTLMHHRITAIVSLAKTPEYVITPTISLSKFNLRNNNNNSN